MTRKHPAFPSLCTIFFFFLLCAIQTSAQSSNSKPRITQPVDEKNLVVLHGNTYPLARPEFDQGAAPASLPMQRMLLVLQRSPEQEAALEQLLEQQQDNSSPSYHRWLTPQQFGAEFGPAAQDIQTITAWLQSYGFQVAGVSKGGIVIEFSGTAGQVQEAFHTSIHKFLVNGEQRYANASDPQIPAALALVVAGVRSLHNFPATAMNRSAGVFHRDKDSGKIIPSNPLAIPQFYPGPNYGCGILGGPCELLGPYDLATIYNVAPLWSATSPIDGTGQTIAIVGETDINPADWTSFWNMFGVAAPKGTLNIMHNGPVPGVQGDEAEADIDTQWSSAVAKGATIDYVVSQSTEATLGVDLSAEFIVDNNLAGVMSESYGVCELFVGTTGNAYYNALWQQASAQGITVFLASGDQGSAACDRGAPAAQYGLAVSGFESTPYNVSVGGTDFNDLGTTATYWNLTNTSNQANAKGYIPEMTWNDSCTNSELFPLAQTANAEQTCNDLNLPPIFLAVAGGSGGASNCTSSDGVTQASCTGGYAKPSWQNAPGVPNDKKRDVPDVSLFASNGFNTTFYVICQSDAAQCTFDGGNISGYGGTSVSSPAFAGIMALINQKTGERQGNANYVFYKMAGTASNSCNSSTVPITGTNNCIFYDIPAGSTIRMPCVTGSPNCTTSTTRDQFGVLSGYDTTAGYDLATGLGSVNVENLVNQWSTYAGQFKGSKFSSFTLGPPTTIAHGQPIPVAATVVPQSGTGTPSGTVVLIANTGTGPSGEQVAREVFTLSGGSLPGGTTATLLPGGINYTVTAHYSGDSTFAPSDSSPQTITVSPEPSKSFANLVTFGTNGFLTSYSASSATYGAGFYLLRFDVGDAGATFSSSTGIFSKCSNQLSSCPTGSLAITSNGTPFDGGSLALNNEGYAEIQTLQTGTYAVAASYPGDPSYGANTATANFTIAKAPTTASADTAQMTLSYGNDHQTDGAVQSTSIGAEPTGTFSFFVDGSPAQPLNLFYQGFPYQPNATPPTYAYLDATGDMVFLTLGKHSLTMQYTGDTNYASATSPPWVVNVIQALPSFSTYGASSSTINLGQQVTLTAILYGSAHGAPPTGSMTFYDDTTAIPGTITYTPTNSTASGGSLLTASLPWTPTMAGNRSITVNYSGDANYLPFSSLPPAGILTVIGPTFNVAANPTTVFVSAPGRMGSTMLIFTAMNGFSGTIPLSPALCAGMPSETTCSFSASSVTLSSTITTATATVTFQTTGASTAPPQSKERPLGFRPWRLSGNLVVMWVFCMGVLFAGLRARRRRWSAVATLLAIASLLVISSCGGNGSGGGHTNPGTPVGNDPNVVITFNVAGVTPAPTVNLSVNVQ